MKDAKIRWPDSLQKVLKILCFSYAILLLSEKNQECRAKIIWHFSLSAHLIISVFSVTIRAEIKGGLTDKAKVLPCAYKGEMVAYD